MSKAEYRVKKELPGMRVGSVWEIAAQERRPDGLAVMKSVDPVMAAHLTCSIPARYLSYSEYFELMPFRSDTELFQEAFYEWLREHGVDQPSHVADHLYTIDMNELKAAIMKLDYSQFRG